MDRYEARPRGQKQVKGCERKRPEIEKDRDKQTERETGR